MVNMIRSQLLKFFIGLWLLGSSLTVVAQERIHASEHLFMLIHQRLALMQQIALYKYHQNLPIYTPKVEKETLLKVKQDAQRLMLPVEETLLCFNIQLQIARSVQQSWHHYWQERGLPVNKPLPDIDKVLRPEIARLTTAIIEQMAKAKEELADPSSLPLLALKIDQIVDVPFVNETQKRELLNSLIQVANSAESSDE